MRKDTETYIGDGLYASFDGYSFWLRVPRDGGFDGYSFWLRAPRDGGDHEVALEPDVLAEFLAFIEAVRVANSEPTP